MLRSLKDLERYAVSATDGDVGSVANFLFDDEHWTVRYLVVETGKFFNEHRVLITPASFRQIEWSNRHFHLALPKDKIKNSPSVDADKPVSRQHEQDMCRYYGYDFYWGVGTTSAHPDMLVAGARDGSHSGDDVHLRSVREVRGYHIQGSDDAIGHVADFIVDDDTWEIRYLVVDTSNWWVSNEVLVAPRWANRISWLDKKVLVDLSRDTIKNCPRWDPTAPINREYETRLYDYYGRPRYWFEEPRLK